MIIEVDFAGKYRDFAKQFLYSNLHCLKTSLFSQTDFRQREPRRQHSSFPLWLPFLS